MKIYTLKYTRMQVVTVEDDGEYMKIYTLKYTKMTPLKYTRMQVFTDEDEWEGYEDIHPSIHKYAGGYSRR